MFEIILKIFVIFIIFRINFIVHAIDEEPKTSTEVLPESTTIISKKKDSIIKTPESETSIPEEDSHATSTISNAQQNYIKAKDLPNCKRNNNEFKLCLQEILKMGLERLKNGSPEHNLPSLDPFVFNRTVYQYTAGPIKGELFIHRARIYGITKIQYDKVRFRKRNKHMDIGIWSHIPKMHITGNYKGHFRYNNFTVRPKGSFNVTLSDVKIEEKSEALISAEGQRNFLRFYNMNLEPKIGNMTIKISGMFEDNRLNDTVLNVINQYWAEFYRVLYTTIKDYWTPIALLITNESLKMAPFAIKT